MGVFLIAIIVLAAITLATGSAVTKRARAVAGRQSNALDTMIVRVSWLGAFSGCVMVDLFSSAYVRILAGGMLSGVSRYGRGRDADDPFGAFALLTLAEHVFLMVAIAFAGAALACWGYLRYDAAREAARLPASPS